MIPSVVAAILAHEAEKIAVLGPSKSVLAKLREKRIGKLYKGFHEANPGRDLREFQLLHGTKGDPSLNQLVREQHRYWAGRLAGQHEPGYSGLDEVFTSPRTNPLQTPAVKRQAAQWRRPELPAFLRRDVLGIWGT